jgi:hypothetical protein
VTSSAFPDFLGFDLHRRLSGQSGLIAARYRVSIADIRRFNGFTRSSLRNGERLFLPGRTMTPWTGVVFTGRPFANPLPLSVLTSEPSGLRRDSGPGDAGLSWRRSISPPRPGTEVLAAHDGVVEFCGWAGGYGKLVVLRHAFGYRTYYGHLSRIHARPGTTVPRGRVAGAGRFHGYSTGPHLHFVIRHYSRQFNPLAQTIHRHMMGRRFVKDPGLTFHERAAVFEARHGSFLSPNNKILILNVHFVVLFTCCRPLKGVRHALSGKNEASGVLQQGDRAVQTAEF